MTDSRLSFTARAIILLLGLSLLVMLGVTIKERVSNPHLVTERPTAPQGMGQEQNLLASLMQKVAAEPTNKDALMHLAEHLMATQEWDAAATFAQRAVALDVNDPQPLYMLGVILHNQGKPQEAAATLEKVVALRDDATVRYSLGVLYSYFLQQKDKGRAHWEAGLKDPKISPEMRQAIEEELKKLPQKPGVYLMHDAQDNIIYVGKAIRLRSRVQSYFREKINRGPQIEKMVTQIARFEYIVTDSELEALVLENNLIKEHNPKYNTLLKDDKTYPYIKVTVGEAYPRVQFSRLMKKDKSKYFGPFTSAAAVKDTIELLNKLFKLRTCNRVLPRDCGLERPCLNYHIGQCMAPCQDYVSREEYRAHVDKALEFLNGNYNMILNDLQKKMEEAAEALEFEEAARYRDLFNSVKQVSQKQKITDSDGEDKDIIALDKDGSDAVVQVFFVRSGKLIGREHFYMTHVSQTPKEQILQDFVKQFYAGTPFVPKEIMLPMEIEDADVVAQWLSAKRGQKVYIRVPKKGQREKLVELAEQNAVMVLTQDKEKIRREEGRTIGAVKEIADLQKIIREKADLQKLHISL